MSHPAASRMPQSVTFRVGTANGARKRRGTGVALPVVPRESGADEGDRMPDMPDMDEQIVDDGDYCTSCGGPIDHNEPHTVCNACNS